MVSESPGSPVADSTGRARRGDRHSGPRGGVELVDHLGVGEPVHLDVDRAPGARRALLVDELDDPGAHRHRGRPRAARSGVAAEPGEGVEEVRHVARDRRVGGEQPDVLVDARGLGVVVAGADVAVAAHAVGLAPQHERGLRVGLVPHDAVDDVDARVLERPWPTRCCGLVEARLQLDEGGDLLAALRGADERRRRSGCHRRSDRACV